MNITSSKRLGIIDMSDTPVTPQTNKNLYDQVLYQKDYCGIICQYLRIKEILTCIILLSTYHFNLIDKKSKNIVKQCLFYDYGDILALFNINLNQNDKGDTNNSVCAILSHLYCDWQYLIEKAQFTDHTDDDVRNFTLLTKLERVECLQHWIHKV